MILFNYETDFNLTDEVLISNWINNVIKFHNGSLGEVNYIFCDDAYLHKLNVQFLQHDTLTDIISFDNTLGDIISGDIFISIDRVKENSENFNTTFTNELYRVIIHGILHFLGFKDKTVEEKNIMRSKEEEAINMLNN